MGDGDHTSPSPRGGPGGEYFVLVPPLARKPAVPKTSLRAVSSVSGSQEGESCELCITGLLPSSSLASGQQWVPKSSRSAHSWNQVRAVTLESPLHIVTCRAVTSLKPGSCVSSHTTRNQVCVTLHTQTPPLPSQARPSQAPGRVPVFHHAAPPR